MDQGHFLIYIIAAPEDEQLRKALEIHLARFVKRYALTLWHPQMIGPGQDRWKMQQDQLRQASLVLLLVSAACFHTCEEEIAFLDEHCAATPVLPVLLRRYDLRFTPFAGLQPLPANGVPVTLFSDQDEALQEVSTGICEAVLLQLAPAARQNGKKEKKLQALLADQSAFLDDRLRRFVGREHELAEVQARIAERREQGGYVTITGQAGQGKSSIIAKLVEYYGLETVVSHFIPFRPGPDYQISLLRDLMARLILKHNLSDLFVAAESRAALRDAFLNLVRELSARQRQEIIFIDGLDQIEEDLTGRRDLSFLPDQPPAGIIFVLGTRPDDTLQALMLLSSHAEYQLPPLSLSDFERILIRRDVHLAEGIIEQLHQALQENALYLDLVAKELQEAGALSPRQIIARVAHDPSNLFSLSIQRLRRDALEWREVIKPVLGILLAVQEPLLAVHLRQLLPALDDERLRDTLLRLGGLLTVTGQQAYALFHLKFQDYLREDEAHPHPYVFARDEEAGFHALLAHWCEQGDMEHLWEETKDAKEQFRRAYARRHALTHLYEARLDQQLFAVLDNGSYGRGKERLDRTTRSYVQDLDLGRKAATRPYLEQKEAIALLPVLWKYTLLRCSIKSQADYYPESLLECMLLVHREAEVLGIAELLTSHHARVALLLRIGLHVATHAGRSEDYLQVFRRAQSIASTIEPADERASAWCEIALALTRVQQDEKAIQILTLAKQAAVHIEEVYKQADAWRKIALALAKAQQHAEAIRVLALAEQAALGIKDAYERVSALRQIALALTTAGQHTAAMQAFALTEHCALSIERTFERASALHQIALALAEAQQWERAEQVAWSIEQADERADALSDLALARATAGQQADAWHLFTLAEQIAGSIAGVCERASSLCDLALARAQAGQQKEAIHLLTLAEQVAGRIEKASQRAEILRQIAHALAEIQQWEQAEQVARSIEGAYEKADAWRQIAVTRARAGQWEQAEQVARNIERAHERADALGDIAQTLAKAGQEEESIRILTLAEQVARSSELAFEKADALHQIGQTLAKAGQHADAMHVLTVAEQIALSIEEAFEKADALRWTSQAMAEAGQHADALRVLTLAEEAAISIELTSERAFALRWIGQALATSRQWKQAEQVTCSIEGAFEKAEALSDISQIMATAGQHEDALRVLTEAEQNVCSIERAFEKVSALRAIAVARAQSGQDAEAMRILTEAEQIARSIEHADLRAPALHWIAVARAQAGQWEQAEQTALSIERAFEQTEALRDIALALAEIEQDAEAWRLLIPAEQVARSIELADERASALHWTAMAMATAGLWEQAEQVACSIELADLRTHALSDIGQARAEAGQHAEAIRVLTLAEQAALSSEHAYERASALRTIGQALAEAGQWKQAEHVARSIDEEALRADALRGIGRILAQTRQWDQFLPFLQRTWISAETYASALTVLPLIAPVLVSHPSLTHDLLSSFAWAHAFLAGEEEQRMPREH